VTDRRHAPWVRCHTVPGGWPHPGRQQQSAVLVHSSIPAPGTQSQYGQTQCRPPDAPHIRPPGSGLAVACVDQWAGSRPHRDCQPAATDYLDDRAARRVYADLTDAASSHGWGRPMAVCDCFDYSAPDDWPAGSPPEWADQSTPATRAILHDPRPVVAGSRWSSAGYRHLQWCGEFYLCLPCSYYRMRFQVRIFGVWTAVSGNIIFKQYGGINLDHKETRNELRPALIWFWQCLRNCNRISVK